MQLVAMCSSRTDVKNFTSYRELPSVWVLQLDLLVATQVISALHTHGDTIRGATVQRQLLARVLYVSSFGDFQSLERYASCHGVLAQ